MKTDSARAGAASRGASVIRKNALKSLRQGDNGSGELDNKRRLLAALTRLKKGYFDVRLPEDQGGLDGKIADTFNEVVELHQAMSRELERLSHAVGKQGRLSERASLAGVGGSWAASMQSVNALIGDLVHPISETAR
jgi:methyl-accepting chemotaxis protein